MKKVCVARTLIELGMHNFIDFLQYFSHLYVPLCHGMCLGWQPWCVTKASAHLITTYICTVNTEDGGSHMCIVEKTKKRSQALELLAHSDP